MVKWEELADYGAVEKTINALKKNNIETYIAENRGETKKKLFEIIPKGSEVMTMSSMTLEETGIAYEINESGNFDSVKKKLSSMDREKQAQEMNKIGAAPLFAVGSVHAVTEDGKVLIASASGSQLPAYASSAMKVIWIVSTKKIVKDIDEGMKRIYEHVFLLEDKRAMKIYGMHSGVNKILIVNKEMFPGRITIVFVKENLGF